MVVVAIDRRERWLVGGLRLARGRRCGTDGGPTARTACAGRTTACAYVASDDSLVVIVFRWLASDGGGALRGELSRVMG